MASSRGRDDDYPQTYDRIHLSNIPDYIGGTLSSFLYATPVTFAHEACYTTSTNLRNPPRFQTIAAFDHEYTALSTPSDLEAVFQVRMEPLEDLYEPMPTCRYNRWRRQSSSGSSTSSPPKKRLPREQLEKWFQRLFLKIALPVEKYQIEDTSLIYSPLNSTVFFRLLTHLHNAGYPSHWLSDLWTQILSGTIVTAARPPRSEPLSIAESRAKMPARALSTTAFVAELAALTALWQPTLPFAVLSPLVPSRDDVHRYSVRFQRVEDRAANIATFVLAIYDCERLGQANRATDSLRRHLVDDGKGLAREGSGGGGGGGGLHVVTTWIYDRESRTGTFWFRRDVLEELLEEEKEGEKMKKEKKNEKTRSPEMRIAIWRTDNWTRQSSPMHLSQIHDHGVWVRGEDVSPSP
jgi:hypothetical protein